MLIPAGFFSPWFAVLAVLAMAMWLAVRVLFLWLVITRFSYWLAIVQQKEYRWDRLRLFLSTKEGRQALLIGQPWLVFRIRKLKRPKITPRVLLIAGMAILIWFVTWRAGSVWIYANIDYYQLSSESVMWSINSESLVLIGLWMVIIWLLIPLFVGLATVPTWLISEVVTRWRLRKAKILIDNHRPLVIGITGSYGKTSTRHILSHLLGDKNEVWTPADSHNTRLSIATDIVKNYQGQPIVVLEYGAYTQSEIAKLTKYFPPHVAVITGLTYQHGGLFGSIEKIIQAKSELIAALPAKSIVYWNGECEEAKKIVEAGLHNHRRLHKGSQIEVKRVNPSFVEISNTSVTQKGQLQFQFAKQTIEMSVVGKHYTENIALAIAVAREHGVPTSRIVARLQSFQPNRYFTRVWQSQIGVMVIDDGGSCNPAGFAKILELAKQVDGSPKVVITSGIVDLGVESSRIHQELATQCKSIIDQVLYTGESGREEFKATLGDRVMTDQKAIVDQLKTLKSGSLLIIEGRLPGWVKNYVPK